MRQKYKTLKPHLKNIKTCFCVNLKKSSDGYSHCGIISFQTCNFLKIVILRFCFDFVLLRKCNKMCVVIGDSMGLRCTVIITPVAFNSGEAPQLGIKLTLVWHSIGYCIWLKESLCPSNSYGYLKKKRKWHAKVAFTDLI